MKNIDDSRKDGNSKRDFLLRYNSRISILFLLIAASVGLVAAFSHAWVSDDAYISFRYAENLVQGNGLVFNAGERVEGYTNFSWTVWSALGLRLGADAELWSIIWGIIFYAGSLVVLALHHLHQRNKGANTGFALPVAAILAAAHTDWHVYATGGLETSLFTFLVLAGYVLLVDGKRVLAAGLVFCLATLTRPDGALFIGLAGLYVLLTCRPAIRACLLFALPCLAILIPFELWRFAYYGDWLPNTYYAKSAGIPWYSQGLVYARLYFFKYWVLLSGFPLVLMAWWHGRRRHGKLQPVACVDAFAGVGLAAACALVYTFYIVRVGGDFMYARLLIPATPFYLLLIEHGLVRLTQERPFIQVAAIAGMCAAMASMPAPFHNNAPISGIVDEWQYYNTQRFREDPKIAGLALRQWFRDLPVRIAFLGSEAKMVYYSKVPIAVESEAGLTDAFIAHQPLLKRGRIGHEKHAPASYLITQKGVHFVFHPYAQDILKLNRAIPVVAIRLGDLKGLILHWDPRVLTVLRQRGAVFDDFPAMLDLQSARLDSMPDELVRQRYAMAKRFYFDYTSDPEREHLFLERLSRIGRP
jgi:arabinofuranosyltransferase